MKLNKIDFVLIVGLVFAVGYTSNVFIAHAQNSTANAPIVQSIDNLVYVVIVPIVLSILSLVKGMVDKGILSKKYGTAVVMAADATYAVGDTRQTVNRLAQTSYETAKLASPEAAKYADEKIAPVLDEAGRRMSEYKPKIDDFAAIANSETNNGKKTTDDIQDIKKSIPDEIIPS